MRTPPTGRRPKQYSQATRLIRMIRILGSRPMTTQELAQEFGTTPRQVYRDRKQIEASGIPLVSDGGIGEQGWRVDPQYKWLPPDPPTASELMSLYLAKSALTYLKGTPFMDDLGNLSRKVEATLPPKTANHLERIVQVFFPLQRPVRSYGTKKSVLASLQKALLLQRPVTILHRAGGYEKAVPHRVEPYGLVLFDFGLYLAGYSHRERAQRLFAVERIVKATVDMEAGPIKVPTAWSLSRAFRHAFGLKDGPPLKVRVRFSREVAHFFKERRWHPTQRVSELTNGDVVITLRAGGLEEITSWVLFWGAHAQALSPPELVKAVADQHAAALRYYASRSR